MYWAPNPPKGRYNTLSIASISLGIGALVVSLMGGSSCVLFCFVGLILGIFAIIMGLIALMQITRDPAQEGRGISIAGIILGTISVIIFLVFTLMALLYVLVFFIMGPIY